MDTHKTKTYYFVQISWRRRQNFNNHILGIIQINYCRVPYATISRYQYLMEGIIVTTIMRGKKPKHRAVHP